MTGQGRDGPREPRVARRKKLARALTEERQRRGWTQAQVAEHLGVGARTLRRWENGKGHPLPGSLYDEAVKRFLGHPSATTT